MQIKVSVHSCCLNRELKAEPQRGLQDKFFGLLSCSRCLEKIGPKLPLLPVCVNPYPTGLRYGFEERGAMLKEMGMEGSCCGALTIRVPSGRVVDHISGLLDGLRYSGLSGEEGKAATFPELIRLYYFPFREATDTRMLSVTLRTHRFNLYRNRQTIPWGLFF